jgi:hypothetical protein
MGLSGGVQAEQGFRLKKGSHLALPPPHLVSLPKNGREIAGAALRGCPTKWWSGRVDCARAATAALIKPCYETFNIKMKAWN